MDPRLQPPHHASLQAPTQAEDLSSLLLGWEDVSPQEALLREEYPTLLAIQELIPVLATNMKALADYQRGQLTELITHALATCPWYQEKAGSLSREGLSKDPVRWMANLPLLTKRDVQQNLEGLWSEEHVHDDVEVWMTSGSTGEPTQFMVDPFTAYTRDLGMWLIQYLQGNRDLTGTQRQLQMLRLSASEGPDCWKTRMFLYGDAWLVKLPLYLHESCNVGPVFTAIREGKPPMLGADPQAFLTLMDLWAERYPEESHFPYRLTSLTSGGNQLSEAVRTRIEAFFQRPVMDCYGLSETSIVASQCSHGRYHIHSPLNWVEVVDEANQRVPYGELGELVVTSLMNWTFPFLRYKTGDMGRIDTIARCDCGVTFPILHDFQGRKRRYFLKADGSLLAPQVLVPAMTALPVYQFQLIQETPTAYRLRVVPKTPLTADDIQAVESALVHHTGGPVALEIEVIEGQLVAPGVKFQDFISHCHHSEV